MTLNENPLTKKAVAALIDHTLLKPDASHAGIVSLCKEAREFEFASVCVNPYWVEAAVRELTGSPVKVCTVIGFPLGAGVPQSKLAEATIALRQGATELDMVQNIGALRSNCPREVLDEIAALASLAHGNGAILKVILETCLLSDPEKILACQLAVEAHADFVKTSTGFSTGGATVADVALMRETVGLSLGVKASGGIRTLADLQNMVAAGATRIGASAGVAILREMTEGSPDEHAGPGGY